MTEREPAALKHRGRAAVMHRVEQRMRFLAVNTIISSQSKLIPCTLFHALSAVAGRLCINPTGAVSKLQGAVAQALPEAGDQVPKHSHH